MGWHLVGRSLLAFLALSLSAGATRAADLSPTERRWLQGAWPVITYAKEARLPLDIVVQPQPTPGAAPLALAFVDGRCKLVLSMRGNDEAQATLDRVAPELLDVTLELMAAHELGHCRRYLDGAWAAVPAGFAAATAPASLDPALRGAYAQMKVARREEGYGDLVGLAWVQRHHPRHYARLHAWLVAERSQDRIPGSHHDTLAWLTLARDGVLRSGGSVFAEAAAMWTAGLGVDE
jgi:hypothetical protein